MAVVMNNLKYMAEVYIDVNRLFLTNEKAENASEVYLARRVDEGRNLKNQLIASLTPFQGKEKMMDDINKIIGGYIDLREKNYRSETNEKAITNSQRFRTYDYE